MPSTNKIDRRTLMRSAAWAIPVVAVAVPAPAFAASATCGSSLWNTDSNHWPGTLNESLTGFNYWETMTSNPPGWFQMQHWDWAHSPKDAEGLPMYNYWRISIVVPRGAETGAVITIPLDPTWTIDPAVPVTVTTDRRFFGNNLPDDLPRDNPGPVTYALAALPANVVEVGSSDITITFTENIPVNGGGTVLFRANYSPTAPRIDKPAQDGSTISTYNLHASATMQFTPLVC